MRREPTLLRIIGWFIACGAVILALGAVNIWLGVIAMIIAVPLYDELIH